MFYFLLNKLRSDVSELHVLPVPGIKWATASAGIKESGEDIAVMIADQTAMMAGVFTQNAFCAAPVIIAKQHISHRPLAWLINAGNANAGTGEEGMTAAKISCQVLAEVIGELNPEQVLPFSTGVIGELLPVDKITKVMPTLVQQESSTSWLAAAKAIMTTDTKIKFFSKSVKLKTGTITLSGIAKGSGMIKPDMATMLAFIGTDANISQELLQKVLSSSVDKSFNRITVDGDTSTNDACAIVATGQAGHSIINDESQADYDLFSKALNDCCVSLAKQIVKDGEGATKFITVEIVQAKTAKEALAIAYSIAHSPLVKTAFFAEDANWGRILAAIGKADIPDLVISKININLNDICIVEKGARSSNYQEYLGQQVMQAQEITIKVALGRGEACETVWTTDLSYEYVRINAEYRS
ncbi:bifunctional glutamate N-acetyltransferase/amino-acid acetyltransferase ArgJ [Zooshikella sp. WH53]|uniref:Arginine biosynthesis bifunctional protein ArgJ n=2 Tax=Zooshikella harenae TaxID=2827238 RepID=A0ABS5Z868_9GAMM|nr:bifunctional glutamate N-acetyltransferase/amino-acid acetyltransferase ArgJ [Zooshikella harenae]